MSGRWQIVEFAGSWKVEDDGDEWIVYRRSGPGWAFALSVAKRDEATPLGAVQRTYHLHG